MQEKVKPIPIGLRREIFDSIRFWSGAKNIRFEDSQSRIMIITWRGHDYRIQMQHVVKEKNDG